MADLIFLLLASLYAVLFVMAPVLSAKIVDLGFAGAILPVGAIGISFAYMLLDVIHDSCGKSKAKQTVIAAAMARAVIYLMVVPVILLIPSENELHGFHNIMYESIRLFLASEIAMVGSQLFIDIPVFASLRKKTHAAFWLRYNLSTVISNAFSIVVFSTLGFAGTGRGKVVGIISGIMLVRLALTVALTPIAVCLRWLSRGCVGLLLIGMIAAPAGAQALRIGAGSTFTERGADPHVGLFATTGEWNRLSANAVARVNEDGDWTYLAKGSLRVVRGLQLEAGWDFLPHRDHEPEPVVGLAYVVPLAERLSAVAILNAEPLNDWGWAAIFRVNFTLWRRDG